LQGEGDQCAIHALEHGIGLTAERRAPSICITSTATLPNSKPANPIVKAPPRSDDGIQRSSQGRASPASGKALPRVAVAAR